MTVDRRSVLKGMAAAGALTALGSAVEPAAEARDRRVPPPDAMGMLYDATKCIGCKTCMVACQDANDLPRDTRNSSGLYDAPDDLNSQCKNIIKLFKDADRMSYMKAQCMHCVDPACINACMLGSLKKREHGIVTWHGERCTGCRYCGIACPYGVPTYEFEKAWPKVVKCEMCNHRIAKGQQPACCEVCPKQAVIYGKYKDLLADAKERIANNPGLYEPKVFGETDGGGTQVLYLSKAGISFQDLGLPELGETPVPEMQQVIQHSLYQGFIAPVALFAVFGAVIWRNRKKAGEEVDP
jgi:Fe-S-cluster-containing dehydrogenase component